jgi:hypothetical protein
MAPHIRTVFCYVAHVRISSKRTPRAIGRVAELDGVFQQFTVVGSVSGNLLALRQLRANTASIQNSPSRSLTQQGFSL